MHASKPVALAVCVLMVLQTFLSMPVTSSGDSRAGEFFVWGTKESLTNFNAADHMGDIGIDSQGNLHYVWMNETGTIYWAKTDQNKSYLGGPRILGTSNRAYDANPRLYIDDGDQVHVTWSNNTGPNLMRSYDYVKLSSGGSIVSRTPGAGGDAIVAYSTGFATLRFYNVSGPSPPAYGPLSLLFYNTNGALQRNVTVGYHERGFEHVSMVWNTSGYIFIVYLMNQTVMNMTIMWGQGIVKNQTALLAGRVAMKSPQLFYDSEYKLQLVWIDGVPNPNYVDAGVYGMRIGPDGDIQRSPSLLIKPDRDTYKPSALSRLVTKGFDEFPVMSKGHYTDMGSGGDEIPEFYQFGRVKNDGTVLFSKTDFIRYCSNNEPVIAQSGPGIYFLVWGERACLSGGGGSNWKGDLFFMRSYGSHSIDLAVRPGDVTYPDRIFPGEEFSVKVKVTNLGDWQTTDFVLNITDNATGDPVTNGTGNLGPGANITLEFKFILGKEVTYRLHIDPMSNPDANLSNNDAKVTLKPVARPDLAISSQNITFSRIRPNIGQSTEVSAQIVNLGGPGAQADVFFFDGINGSMIGKTKVDFNSTTTTTSIFWGPKNIGVRTIVVRITNVTPAELPGHNGNNEAKQDILVGSPTVPSIEITAPASGETLEVGTYKIKGRAWDPDGDALSISIRFDGGSWEQAAATPNSTFKGLDWFIDWDLKDTKEGNHTIIAQVLDDIHENSTLVNIKVVKYLVPFRVTGYAPKNDPTINETQNVTFEVSVDNLHGLDLKYYWTIDGFQVNGTTKYLVTTTYLDAGVYNVTINVTWENVKWSHSWKLTVRDVNRPPRIGTYSPTQQQRPHQTTNITFEVKATDPDNDTLTYAWTVNGKPINGTKSKNTVLFDKDGLFYVNVTVSDGKGGLANHSWAVEANMHPPPCCLPPPKYHTWLEDAVWIFIVIIGVITMVCIGVIYYRISRFKGVKKGDDSTKASEELGPPGRIS